MPLTHSEIAECPGTVHQCRDDRAIQGNPVREFRFDSGSRGRLRSRAQSSISNVRRTGWFATMTAAGSKADLSVTSRPHVTGS